MSRCGEGAYTHVDSTNPFRFLGGTERSPFFPYCWLRTGARTIRARYAHYRPNKDQSDGEDTGEVHTSGARMRADVEQKIRTIYCFDCLDSASG